MRSNLVGGAAATGLILALAQPAVFSAEPTLEPFKGVTTNGIVQKGLFPRATTGIAHQQMVEAAKAFLGSLTPEQRENTQFPINSDIKRRWTNVASAKRFGISYAEMTPAQRQKADALLQAFLSAEGYRQSKDIMRINGYLAQATGNHERYGEELFWISLFGDPSAGNPWGWRLEGHHLVLAVNIVGDQVVLTPTFMGAEPTSIPTGVHQGVAVMQTQETTARTLINSLNAKQQSSAHLSSAKAGSHMLSEAYKDNAVIPQAGISARELSKHQQQLLMAVITSFANQYREELSDERLKEVRAHLNDTTFAWIGNNGINAPMYYRIQSPVLLIEFDQQRAVSLPGDPNKPLRSHVHTMVRTPNGNDYGENLLQQHLQQDHNHSHQH